MKRREIARFLERLRRVTSELKEVMWLPAMPTLTGPPRTPQASIAAAIDSLAACRSTTTPLLSPWLGASPMESTSTHPRRVSTRPANATIFVVPTSIP